MPAPKTNTNAAAVRTPGEAATASTSDDTAGADTNAAGAVSGTQGTDADAGADPVTTKDVLAGAVKAKALTMEERFALMEENQARLEAENKTLREGQLQLLKAAHSAAVQVPVEELPHARDFPLEVQKEMTSAVLTKDGWIVPAHLGSSPVLHELQKLGLSATA